MKTYRVIEFVRNKSGEGYTVKVLHQHEEISEAVGLVTAYRKQGRHTTVEEEA